MAPIIKTTKNKQTMVVIKAPNNKTVATTETYKTKQAAIKAVESIKKAVNKPIVDKTNKSNKKK